MSLYVVESVALPEDLAAKIPCEGMGQECTHAAAWLAKLPCGHGAPFCDSCRRRCDWIIETGGHVQCRSEACPWSALIEWSRL